MKKDSTYGDQRWIAALLCVLVAASAAAAPKKAKDSSDTIDIIRGKSKPSPSRAPQAAPAKRPAPRSKPAPRVVKSPSSKPATVSRPVAPSIPTLYVSPGGQDPFKSIADALAKAPAGAQVLVRTGVYTESLVITRPVEIAPATLNDAVAIESPRGPALLMRTARATVRNLALRQMPGVGIGDYTVEVPQGTLVLDGCTIASGDKAALGVYGSGTAPRLRKCELRGKVRGLHLFGRAKATLDECVVLESGFTGALVESEGELTAKASRFGANGLDGLKVQSASVVIDDCEFSGNKHHGLTALGATVAVTRSRAYENAQDGIWLDEKSKGTLQGTDCFRNQRTGLVFRGESEVHATGCKVYENKEGFVAGIKARGILEQSEITGNSLNAVLIKEESAPVLRRCRIVGAEPDAVAVIEGSGGTFEGCDVSKTGKGHAAVAVHTGAKPVFRQSRFHGAWTCAFLAVAQPTFEDCDFYDSAGPGLEILDGGTPRLTDCRIRGAGEAGLKFYRKGAGTFERCEITGSGKAGVQIVTDANPTLTSR